MKIPFMSDRCISKIKEAAKSLQIPVRVVTTPGKKLRDILTSSRPLDKKKCPNNNCRTCTALNNSGNCRDRNLVYECGYPECRQNGIGLYNGKTYRPIGADGFTTHHQDGHPNLELKVLQHTSTTVDRKIKEARFILKNKVPDLNNCDERIELRKYSVFISSFLRC